MSFNGAQKTYSIKVTFKDETRRLQLSAQNFDFSSLKKAITDLMPSIQSQTFLIQWQDDEISLPEGLNGEVKKMEKLGDQPIHTSITCDDCGMSPIVGIRYKCTVRNDFDVCENCEAKSNHPYPFIKIADPSHTPAVLIYAFQDDNQPIRPPHPHPHPHPHPQHGHGFRWGRCGRGSRPPHHPWDSRGPQNIPPPPPSPFGRPFGRHGPSRWEKKCNPSSPSTKESASEKAAEIPVVNEDEFTDDVYDETLPSGNPIRAAVDAFAEKLGAEESKESGSGIPTPLPQEDKRSNYHNFSLPQENLHNMASNIAEMASSYLEKEGIAELASSFLNAHIPGNSKPALRFVRHVTCPDGTLVPPSVPFCKTWRVRNDGKIAWPEGSVLVHSSGDQLTYEEPVALETLPGPGEEVDITVNLKSPGCTGRFVSYFRMQTKEMSWFGQRLWTDIIVSDDETDWHGVGQHSQRSSPVAPPTATATATAATSFPVAPAAVVEIAPPAPVAVPPVPVPETAQSDTVPLPPVPVSLESRPAVPLFARELRVLADMGFTDSSVVMPLLHEHVENAENPTLGLQRVVAALFSDEGIWH